MPWWFTGTSPRHQSRAPGTMLIRPRLGRRGLRTPARLPRPQGVEPAGQAAALACRGVLVNGVLGGDLVHDLDELVELRRRLLQVPRGHGRGDDLPLIADLPLAPLVPRPPLEVLPNPLFRRQ